MAHIIKESAAISLEKLKSFKEEYLQCKKNTVLRHALVKTPIEDLVIRNEFASNTKQIFSLEVKTMPVTNQKQSGRCWIFSALNLLREIIGKKRNISNFELSQNFIGFYDKLEKFNFLQTEILNSIGESHDSRLVTELLRNGIGDGGQWDMFVNVVKKYGLCPKAAFEETYQAYTTASSNKLLNAAIRKFASEVHSLHDNNQDDQIPELKEKYLKKAYSLLTSCYGIPPTSFDFEYYDSDNKYHCEKGYTPISFFEQNIGNMIDEYQSIIQAPTADKDYLKTYTIEHLGNVVGGKKINHLNLTMDRIKELILNVLKDGEPVWFGSDVAFYGNRIQGVWDDNSYDYESAFSINFNFGKAAMLDYHQSAMNHAMLITGATIDNQKPIKWKIENSWGDDRGEKGYFIASDSWINIFLYQVVINKKYLNQAEKDALTVEPISLPLWDPFGTLAD